MTRVHLLSDLHLEFHPYTYKCPKGGVDLIVLAGDISSPAGGAPSRLAESRLTSLLGACNDSAPTVLVAGNHDFYGATIYDRLKVLRDLSHTFRRVRFLEDEAVDVAGLRVAGATLWTNFSLPGYNFGVREAQQMNDFRMIGGTDEPGAIKPAEMVRRYNASAVFLAREMQSARPPDLVVTHFLPAPEAIDVRYARSPLNAYFCTDLRHLMGGPEAPHTWAFGHTHHSVDRKVRDTRIVCNPRGYPGENCDYDSKLVIEVPSRDPATT